MNRRKLFKAFFGMDPSSIRKTVVISPIVYPNRLGKIKYHRSMLGYLVANLENMTFVKTPMLQSAVSDAVVLLGKTPCKEVIFIGIMGGLAKGLKIGDTFRIDKARDIHSVSSFHEETRKKMLALRKKGAVGVDFESKAFFAAAKKSNLSATAYYVITDLPLIKPFYSKITAEEKKQIKDAISSCLSAIHDIKHKDTKAQRNTKRQDLAA